ncbi:glycosyltransferase family 2 protein [Rhodocytophaga rosea]|uniref:Glycosyltransferase family 2 protein n=1 Tax=Rhodocytophaga rosea TaxID=2704465 RepID=A0A6C0GD53_9BACT|nr:glycosyltransferase family 2 protein [Rhodocytophaga rosea]QHT65784.1 glycosyltransferase family 2 protein [Rhodocytophaga rosea]
MNISANPKVSIITCFLNVGEFLQEAIESVLHQQYHNWEMWLIDDGSTDCSTQIAKEYAAKYTDKIIYYEHEGHQNIGASASRNIGIERSTGELIAFLDGDDVWLPNLLAELIRLLQQHKVAMVCEATEYWYTWNESANQNTVTPVGGVQDCVNLPPQLMLDLYPLGKGAAPCICGMLVRKDALQKHGGFESCFKGMYDDQALLIKFYLNEAVYISSGCHNLYRQRPNSLVQSSFKSGRYYQDRKQFLEWLKRYFTINKIENEMINKTLKKVLYPYRYPFIYAVTHTLPRRGMTLLRKINRKLS